MSYNVLTIPPFDRQLKRLSKKHPAIKSALSELIESLENNPKQGVSLGNNCYKIRLAIASKSKGKRGGARVVTNVVITDEKVFLIALYDKSDQENIADQALKELIKQVSR